MFLNILRKIEKKPEAYKGHETQRKSLENCGYQSVFIKVYFTELL